MMENSSAAVVTVSNNVHTELIAYFADCMNYSEKKTVDSRSVSRMQISLYCWLHVLSAPVSEAGICASALSLWTADSRKDESAD